LQLIAVTAVDSELTYKQNHKKRQGINHNKKEKQQKKSKKANYYRLTTKPQYLQTITKLYTSKVQRSYKSFKQLLLIRIYLKDLDKPTHKYHSNIPFFVFVMDT
jgi:hypothetical protein